MYLTETKVTKSNLQLFFVPLYLTSFLKVDITH